MKTANDNDAPDHALVVTLTVRDLRALIRSAVEDVLATRPAESPGVLTVREAASVARLHRATIRARILDGTLPAARAGRDWRIRRDDLERFMGGRTDAA